jgi:oligopeptide transport system permease protein
MENNMGKYIIKRLVISVITVWLIATTCFFLLRTLPGNPFQSTTLLSEEMVARMMHYYGLDRPLWQQYLTYMNNLLHGNFGYSLKYAGRSVNDIIASTFPISAQLGIQAYIVAIPLGLLFGIIAARNRGKAVDYGLVAFSVLGISVPIFILAALLQYVFAIKTGLLPVAQWKSFRHTILPTLTLAFSSIAGKTRLMRTYMLEIINEDYMKTAKAKGLSKYKIIWSHQIRNAVIPMVPTMGMELVGMLMGSFVVEQIYAIPGIGAQFVTSIQSLDYTMTLGLTVFFGVFVVAANFIVDLVYGLVDPRIRVR